MRAPTFGLSTTPVMAIKSALRLQLERDLLALVYRRRVCRGTMPAGLRCSVGVRAHGLPRHRE
jgi:hypothetical protein